MSTSRFVRNFRNVCGPVSQSEFNMIITKSLMYWAWCSFMCYAVPHAHASITIAVVVTSRKQDEGWTFLPSRQHRRRSLPPYYVIWILIFFCFRDNFVHIWYHYYYWVGFRLSFHFTHTVVITLNMFIEHASNGHDCAMICAHSSHFSSFILLPFCYDFPLTIAWWVEWQ